MREKKRIDYIYYTGDGARPGRISWMQEDDGGIAVLRIAVGQGLARERLRRRLKTVLRQFDISEAVMDADRVAARALQMEPMLFRAYAQELLQNRELVIRSLSDACDVRKKRGVRRIFAIVVGDARFGRTEIVQLLVTAKDWFEELAIFDAGCGCAFDSIAEEMYREWGVCLQTGAMRDMRGQYPDALLLLGEGAREAYGNHAFGAVYLAYPWADQPILEDEQANTEPVCFCGMRYAVRGVALPDGMGRCLAVQKPWLYRKIRVTIVAIFRVKWYT